jgi:PHD/YefM family antitoxin component YafN of YafNO toxin-antitoxin module
MGEVVQAKKSNLRELLKRVTNGKRRVWIEQDDGPPAVMMNAEEYYDYLERVLPMPASLARAQKRSRELGLNKMSDKEINDIIAEVREERLKRKRA